MDGRSLRRYGEIIKHVNNLDEDKFQVIKKYVASVVVGDIDNAFDGYWNAREMVKGLMKEGVITKGQYQKFTRLMTVVFKDRFGVHPSKVMISKISKSIEKEDG